MKAFVNALCIVGYFVMLFANTHAAGFKGVVFITVAASLASIVTANNLVDEEDEVEPEHDSCEGCKHNLGGGCCSINVEDECNAGGGFELYEEE